MIQLSNYKFGYKLLHNMLPLITNNLCMTDSKNELLTRRHKYNTRYKSTPYLPKNATTQYKSSFLCKGPQSSLMALNVETCLKPSLHSFTMECKHLLSNNMQTLILTPNAVKVETFPLVLNVETYLLFSLLTFVL